MSSEEMAAKLNEVPNKSVHGLILGMAIKYGLPSICCIYLFYVIEKKDRQIFEMANSVTAALVTANNVRDEGNEALKRLADAVDRLSDSNP